MGSSMSIGDEPADDGSFRHSKGKMIQLGRRRKKA
jgi:hypothetical protein